MHKQTAEIIQVKCLFNASPCVIHLYDYEWLRS